MVNANAADFIYDLPDHGTQSYAFAVVAFLAGTAAEPDAEYFDVSEAEAAEIAAALATLV
jgi:hypothetical protein